MLNDYFQITIGVGNKRKNRDEKRGKLKQGPRTTVANLLNHKD